MSSGGSSTCRCYVMVIACLCSITVVVYALRLAWIQGVRDQPNTNSTGYRAVQDLKFVYVVSRHGNRRSFYTFPNDPYPLNDTVHWPYGLGELTTHGRLQMYHLGVKVRKLYNGFISEKYYPSEIYSSSNTIDRTLMSGETFLAGLFPPTGFQLWNWEILWQPVPLHSINLDKSQVIESCPKYVQERNAYVKQFQQQYRANLSTVNGYLNQHTGANFSGVFGVHMAWDVLFSEDTEGFVLPDWARKVYPQPLADLNDRVNIMYYAPNDTMARLLIGTFYNEMLGVFKSKVNGTMNPDRQMFYYSGHDTSIVALQHVLGIAENSTIGLVKPSSALIIELHQDPVTKEFSVQVLYIDGSSSDLEPVELSMPDCSPCSFDKFFNITQRFCVTDYEAECQLTS